jgi:drug/metabolite transporter (DMT)-like permease
MPWIPDIFALLVAAAGWYYMFYSRAAHKLEGVENAELNLKRIRLRRIGGFVMMLFAVLFFAGFNTIDPKRHPALFLALWGVAFVLLGAMVVLALVDIRLTARLRRRQ